MVGLAALVVCGGQIRSKTSQVPVQFVILVINKWLVTAVVDDHDRWSQTLSLV